MSVSGVLLAREFPEIIEEIDEQLRPVAMRQTAARVVVVRPGAWEPARAHRGSLPTLGLMVVEGLLARRVRLGHRSCVELLGAGDMLRPWAGSGEGSSIAIDARWVVQNQARIAVLDRQFALRIAAYPEITGWLMDRAIRRAHWLAFHQAVCTLPALQTRLQVLFWYLADRWGRVTRDGVEVPLALTHSLIGNLVGAHRPATTSAIGELTARGWLARHDHGWLLLGDRPAELDDVQLEAQGEGKIVAQ